MIRVLVQSLTAEVGCPPIFFMRGKAHLYKTMQTTFAFYNVLNWLPLKSIQIFTLLPGTHFLTLSPSLLCNIWTVVAMDSEPGHISGVLSLALFSLTYHIIHPHSLQSIPVHMIKFCVYTSAFTQPLGKANAYLSCIYISIMCATNIT